MLYDINPSYVLDSDHSGPPSTFSTDPICPILTSPPAAHWSHHSAVFQRMCWRKEYQSLMHSGQPRAGCGLSCVLESLARDINWRCLQHRTSVARRSHPIRNAREPDGLLLRPVGRDICLQHTPSTTSCTGKRHVSLRSGRRLSLSPRSMRLQHRVRLCEYLPFTGKRDCLMSIQVPSNAFWSDRVCTAAATCAGVSHRHS